MYSFVYHDSPRDPTSWHNNDYFFPRSESLAEDISNSTIKIVAVKGFFTLTQIVEANSFNTPCPAMLGIHD
jgi:hypothetical protein